MQRGKRVFGFQYSAFIFHHGYFCTLNHFAEMRIWSYLYVNLSRNYHKS